MREQQQRCHNTRLAELRREDITDYRSGATANNPQPKAATDSFNKLSYLRDRPEHRAVGRSHCFVRWPPKVKGVADKFHYKRVSALLLRRSLW